MSITLKRWAVFATIIAAAIGVWVFRAGFAQPPAVSSVGTTQVIVSFEESKVSPEDDVRDLAVTRARRFLGLPPETIGRARVGYATDTTIPFLRVERRPAWEVVFDGISLAGIIRDGKEWVNPNIHSLTVLLDATTGALLKVSSPKPEKGAVMSEQWPGTKLEKSMTRNMISFRSLEYSRVNNELPLFQALNKGEHDFIGVISQSSQIVAYFGLLTDRKPGRQLTDQPFWLVFSGGLQIPNSNTPPGSKTAPSPATDARLNIEALSGKVYNLELIGKQ
jgi:hypothetical protein